MPEKTLWQLMGIYYELNGVAWRSDIKLATFPNREAAREFKTVAPDWTVQYQRNRHLLKGK